MESSIEETSPEPDVVIRTEHSVNYSGSGNLADFHGMMLLSMAISASVILLLVIGRRIVIKRRKS